VLSRFGWLAEFLVLFGCLAKVFFGEVKDGGRKMAVQVQVAKVEGIKGDVFAEIRLKDTVHVYRTTMQRKCVEPEWDHWFHFQNEVPQRIAADGCFSIKVYCSGLFGNTLMGAALLPLSAAMEQDATSMWLQLQHDDKIGSNRPANGRVLVKCRRVLADCQQDRLASVARGRAPPRRNAAAAAPITMEVVQAKARTIVGDLFVEVRIKGETACGTTGVVPASGHAVWNHAFSFLAKDPACDVFQVKVYAAGAVRALGHSLVGAVEVPVSLVSAAPVDGWFDLWTDLHHRNCNGMSLHLRVYWGQPRSVLPAAVPSPAEQPWIDRPAAAAADVPNVSAGGEPVPKVSVAEPGSTWACPACTFANQLADASCEMCEASRPPSAQNNAQSRQVLSEADLSVSGVAPTHPAMAVPAAYQTQPVVVSGMYPELNEADNNH
jgi:C2 domain